MNKPAEKHGSPAEFVKTVAGRTLDGVKVVLPWLKDHLGLATIAAVAAVAGFLVEQNMRLQESHIASLQDSLKAERAQHESEVGTLKQQISDMLPATVNFPLPYDPPNDSSIVGDHVVLRWNEKSPHTSYIVETTRLDPGNPQSWGQSSIFLASNSASLSTRFPPSPDGDIKPGTYLWRVVPGNLDEGHEVRQGNWRGYYAFTMFDNTFDRVKRSKTLLVGVSYVQNSKFMSRNGQGKAAGFDADLMHALANDLAMDKEFANHLDIVFVDYPTVDQILFHGLLDGEVDLAIGSITKAKYRERKGIQFTHGYFESRLVLLATPGGEAKLPLDSDDKVGVLRESANYEAVQYLKKKYQFQEFDINSWPDLLDELEHHKVDFIVIDKPLAAGLIEKGQVVVAKDLKGDVKDYLAKLVGYDKEEYAIATSNKNLHDKIDHLLTSPEYTRRIADLEKSYHLVQP